MVNVVVCTVGSKSLPVLEASFSAYNPDDRLIIFEMTPSTFGESYNEALETVFKQFDEVIVANDDVVLTPNSISMLMEDVNNLKLLHGDKLGLVAALSDDARMSQNIRQEEGTSVKERNIVSPIFAWMQKSAFEAAKFPPLNWYSDDVICEDLNVLGFKHYISRAYVHHVGSQTVGRDHNKLNNESIPWIRANRPDYIVKWWGKEWL